MIAHSYFVSTMKHHVIISGTGRAGTTFLVQLLTALGLDTGFDSPTSGIFENCRAGMEWDLRHPNAPYIIKNPWLCDYLHEIMGLVSWRSASFSNNPCEACLRASPQ